MKSVTILALLFLSISVIHTRKVTEENDKPVDSTV